MASQQNRRVQNVQHLRPGLLEKVTYDRTATAPVDSRKERAVLDSGKAELVPLPKTQVFDQSSTPLVSPIRVNIHSPDEGTKQEKQSRTPRTPQALHYDSESRLESLPMELVVKIVCHLHHDELRAVFHVSQKIRTAVIQARQLHFNYTTPDRSRKAPLRSKTSLPTERWPFASKGDGKANWSSTPHTPKAPRHGPRPLRLNLIDMKEVSAVLFQEGTLPSRCMVPPGLPRPASKAVVYPRVLF